MKEHNKENLTNLTDFLGTTLKYGDTMLGKAMMVDNLVEK